MMRASVTGKYGTDKSSATATVCVNAGDVKLRASMTEATFINGPSLDGITLCLDKPTAFTFDYNVPKKDFTFRFMNEIKVAEKPLKLTYSHVRGENKTTLDGTLVFDPANKLSANYAFASGGLKVKYTYVHGKGWSTFEPSYDFSNKSWDFVLSQKIYGDDSVRASYHPSNNVLAVDWCRSSKVSGSFKISASINVADEVKAPKLCAESTWDFDI